MGIGNSSMPPPDQHTLKKMEFAKITMSELKRFWQVFRRMDKNLSGGMRDAGCGMRDAGDSLCEQLV